MLYSCTATVGVKGLKIIDKIASKRSYVSRRDLKLDKQPREAVKLTPDPSRTSPRKDSIIYNNRKVPVGILTVQVGLHVQRRWQTAVVSSALWLYPPLTTVGHRSPVQSAVCPLLLDCWTRSVQLIHFFTHQTSEQCRQVSTTNSYNSVT